MSIDQARGDSASAPGVFTAFFSNATVDPAYAPYGIFLLRVAVGIDWIVARVPQDLSRHVHA